MGQNLGNLQAGPQWSDVTLDVNAGDACAISISEDARSNAEWDVRIRAVTDYGNFLAGVVRTRSVANGEAPARLVAVAFYPGARRFVASFRQVAGTTTLGADATLSSTSGAGCFPGVTPIFSTTANERAARSFLSGPPFAGVGTLQVARGGSLMQLHAQMVDPLTAGTNVWIAAFDQAAAPVAGDLPFWSAHLGQAAGGSPDPSHIQESWGPGRPIVSGLWFASSDAAGPLVVSAVPLLVQAEVALP